MLIIHCCFKVITSLCFLLGFGYLKLSQTITTCKKLLPVKGVFIFVYFISPEIVLCHSAAIISIGWENSNNLHTAIDIRNSHLPMHSYQYSNVVYQRAGCNSINQFPFTQFNHQCFSLEIFQYFCILALVVQSNWYGLTTLLLICTQVLAERPPSSTCLGQKNSIGFKFTNRLKCNADKS